MVFQANFDMVMLKGSSIHEHNIYNFTLSNISMTKEKHYTFNGTATLTIKEDQIMMSQLVSHHKTIINKYLDKSIQNK